jgi:hypothetical protein
MKKYRLGNKSAEYELKEDYLEWTMKNVKDMALNNFSSVEGKKLIITKTNLNNKKEKKSLFLFRFIIKDAFPLDFFGEERSKCWNLFAIVAESRNSEKFIIPVL